MLFRASSLFIEDQAWITWFYFSCSRRTATTHHTAGCLKCFGAENISRLHFIQPIRTASGFNLQLHKKIPSIFCFYLRGSQEQPQDFKRLVGAAVCEQHRNCCYLVSDIDSLVSVMCYLRNASFALFCTFVHLNIFFYPHNKHLRILLSGMENKATEDTAKTYTARN